MINNVMDQVDYRLVGKLPNYFPESEVQAVAELVHTLEDDLIGKLPVCAEDYSPTLQEAVKDYEIVPNIIIAAYLAGRNAASNLTAPAENTTSKLNEDPKLKED